MATVYKAKCHVLNRFVAVKVLRDEFTTDEEFIKRFNSEAQAVASLTHPNIVSVYDVGNEGNLYYIVMELIQGKTLKDIIVEDGALSWKWSVNVAIQIASALETAHKNNIIHRDIKPHNIIITEEGRAKVTDFGIAKAVSNSTITAFGTTIGSVHYFSPEHARGGYTDAKSDLYSLGVVMYEMLTGKVPFDADTPVSIALMHMQQVPEEPIKLNPTIPSAVNSIVMKAMRKDLNLRYASATEMLKDLNMALKNPDGEFVRMSDEANSPTQKIPTMYHETIHLESEEQKEEAKENFFKRHKVFTFIFGGILLFIITIVLTYFGLKLTAVKDVQIPNIVGMSQVEAKKTIEDAKLVYQEEEGEYSADVPEGYVIRQDPVFLDNYRIKEKSEVKVVISKGQEITTMPKVVGMTKEEAIEAIETAKLKAEVVEETSKKIEEGYVISQETKENTQINAGETVKIHVSIGTGIQQVSVPYVVGKTEEEAKKAITDAKLKVKQVIMIEDTTKDNGTVLKQDIEAGKTVDEGTEIILTVNKIEEDKTATVYVNVKSITGGYKENDNTITETNKKVELEVVANGDTIYKEKVDKNSTKVNTGNGKVKGKGQIQVKVFIDGVKQGEENINLNSVTSYTFD